MYVKKTLKLNGHAGTLDYLSHAEQMQNVMADPVKSVPIVKIFFGR